MLTINESIDFINRILEISNVEEKLKQNRYELLCSMMKTYVNLEPFQNLILLATKTEDRHCPTFEEIQRDVFSRVGGLCYNHNVFFKYLLDSLGYQAHFISCDIRYPRNHIAIVVKEVIRPGDVYYVDVGCGYLLEQPISMQFDECSDIYHQGFFQCQFVRKNGIVQRIQTVTKFRPVLPNEIIRDKKWYVFSEMTLDARELSYFADSMGKVFTVKGPQALSPFLDSLRLVHKNKGKFVAVRNTSFFFENDNDELVETKMLSKSDVVQCVEKYFPQISGAAVAGLDNLELEFDCK
ncbi:uncharacterized protein LOC117115412 [Anneissia japonica]|uniref:uncharacterized protein LOC117115412 n=1 Tax=Anneissia japonica TaxID=1529436 RepID=UPI001425B733|nr:uncharacterized protein LOC117115412 [Anneissia japonica]XP_033115079.1 uncharacterized protein LOC117115412 [Anneissia japonica]XP_033115080.1 uncharacterized protein LOC117115412 [Anneissia japonica]